MYRPTFVDIDCSAYQHNLRLLQNLAPNSRMVAAVKANAYGHGVQFLIETLNTTLSSNGMAGVCCMEEALELRDLGYSGKILLFEGIFSAAECPLLEKFQITPVVRDANQLHWLQQYHFQRPISVWLKVNTGMNRLGISCEELPLFWQKLMSMPMIHNPPVLMSHFACADALSNQMTMIQINRFRQATSPYNAPISLANSAGILGWSDGHEDWIRPGLSSYGISPFTNKIGADFGLQPVMRFHSKIIAIQPCRAGETIGYGATYQCSKDMRIGVVAAGYADGYPQQAPNGTPVLVNGQKSQIVGRVSMDMLTIDLTELPSTNIGDSVILWGSELPIETIASFTGIGVYELVCRITKRVKINKMELAKI